jgi:hypothetical protein
MAADWAKRILFAGLAPSTLSLGAGPLSLAAMEHDRAQRGGPRIFFSSFLAFLGLTPVAPCGERPRLLLSMERERI